MGSIVWIQSNGDSTSESADTRPSLDKMREFVGGTVELVHVLHNHKRAQLYVNGNGINLGLDINDTATDIYRNFAKSQGMDNPHFIHGNAVLVEGIPLV